MGGGQGRGSGRGLARPPPSSVRLAGGVAVRAVERADATEGEERTVSKGTRGDVSTVDRPRAPGFRTVQVRVYNIDRYGMSPLASAALKKDVPAIWHVGVAVFGREYWYGAVVESQRLADVDYAFGFGPTHIFDIGETDADPDEFHAWVMEEQAAKYVVETYDCFNHNCHHFADDLVRRLTGKGPAEGGFPQWCLDHGEKGLENLSEAAQERTKWVSNRIAKVMMVSWGKYNRERFVSRDQQRVDGEAS